MPPGRLPILVGYGLLLPLAGLILVFGGRLLRSAVAAPFLVLLLLMTVLSTFWSYEPSLTIERLFPLLVTSLTAMVIAGHFDLRAMLIFFGGVFAACMFTSLVAIILFPGARGIPPWVDTWNGIYSHKNGFGAASMISTLLSLICISLTRGRVRAFFVVSIILSLFFLVASESRTSQFIGLISVGAVLVARYFSGYSLLWAAANLIVVSMASALLYALLAFEAIDVVFDALERKPTLSGRIPLWNILIPYIKQEFWFGYGYAAFWVPESVRVAEITRHPDMGFTPFYSHNGPIEVWLAIGVVGLGLLLLNVVIAFADVFTCLRLSERRVAVIGAYVLLIALLFLNVTESSILARSSLLWILLVALIAKLRLAARSLRRHVRRGRAQSARALRPRRFAYATQAHLDRS